MTERVSIRPATSADAETIARHRRAMFVDVLGPFDEGDLEAMDASFVPYVRRGLENGSYRGWLACSGDGQVVAGGGLILHEWLSYPWDADTRRAYIANVYTEPEARGQGIARRILTKIIDWCRDEGLRVVYLHASEHGRPLYESLGFEPTNEMRLGLRGDR
jgi:GNAT superfamily N-acetyltransferase